MADPAGGLVEAASPPEDRAVRLVAIGRDGAPVEPVGDLDPDLAEACRGNAALYERAGFRPPWIGYLSVAGDAPVGICAFKSAPHDGRVEIAYFTLPAQRGRGQAAAAARALVSLAASADPAVRVTARTMPERGPSTRVLERLGFTLAGVVDDPEDGPVWEWLAPAAAA